MRCPNVNELRHEQEECRWYLGTVSLQCGLGIVI
jgi:hypothetical protein